MSLGIGHFIWLPANSREFFQESFTRFLEYARSSGERIPQWLDKNPFPACPWRSRSHFLSAKDDPRLKELKDFLASTKALQVEFIIRQLENALASIIKKAPEEGREKLTSRFYRVASTPLGVYALADYVNFKGLGIVVSERYRGRGWGLLQVLEGIREEGEYADIMEEFSRSANAVLEERIKNSPSNRNEQKWLPGWQKRINTYIKKEG